MFLSNFILCYNCWILSNISCIQKSSAKPIIYACVPWKFRTFNYFALVLSVNSLCVSMNKSSYICIFLYWYLIGCILRYSQLILIDDISLPASLLALLMYVSLHSYTCYSIVITMTILNKPIRCCWNYLRYECPVTNDP